MNDLITEYNTEDRVLVALDCIIFGFDQEKLKLLLIKRNFQPEKGSWSLMGGFLKREESIDVAAVRILNKLTGLTLVYMEQLKAYGAVDRDPVERTLSLAYYALINIEQHDHELSQKYDAKWFDVGDLPDLIFDHGSMVREAMSRLRYKVSVKPVGFELLPEKFTMRQLRKLYEAIYSHKMDKRNFTKKINSMNLLVKLEEKDMASSKRGSYLYMFNETEYKRKLANGFNFSL